MKLFSSSAGIATVLAGAILIAGCSREASEERIREAVAECGASRHARVHKGRLAGESAYVVDFDTTGAELDAQMACVAAAMENAGVEAPTMGGGTGRFRRNDEAVRMDDAPRIDPAFLNSSPP